MELTASGSNKAWRRKADESEAAARTMTRVAALLALATFVTLAYALVTQSHYAGLCDRLKYEGLYSATNLQDFARTLGNGYCE